jgi:hypothetical protein
MQTDSRTTEVQKSVTSQYHAGTIDIEESPSTGWRQVYLAMGVYQ